MKRHFVLKLIATILCTIILAVWVPAGTFHSEVALARTSSNGGVKKGLDYYKKGNYSAAEKQFKKYQETASEDSVSNMSKKMKKAYLQKVLKYKTFSEAFSGGEVKEYIWAYYLTDINKDNLPELLIQHGTCEADCLVTIYKYSKGKAVKVDDISGAHSVFYGYPDGNGFIKLSAHMGYESIALITIKENIVTEKEIGSRDVGNGDYIILPYQLDSHKASNDLDIDYSALK